ISGGKDSLLMTRALSLYKRFSKKDFEIVGITVDLGLKPFDLTAVKDYCENLGVEYHIIPTEIGDIVFNVRKEKNPCSLCAKMRKGALYEAAVNLKCNKIALGHHKDDLIDTFFLSLIYEGKMTALKPKFYLSRCGLTAIRPLIYLPEAHIINSINRLELPVTKSACPANGNTKRDEIRKLVKHLCVEYPDFKDKAFLAIYNKENYQMWNDRK
ncbi:MAG: tRNA 2-thiocytidine biosynthesis protein TtcA, partial [Clostridia bacterium]|nr:tRNA 2-thiocytidine biosynthesis protein TtcA [Clostridia bacterium]